MATTTRRPEGFAVSFKGEGALGAGSSGCCGQNLFQHAGDKIENDWCFEEHLDYDFPYVGNVIIPTDDSSYFSEGYGLTHQLAENDVETLHDGFQENDLGELRGCNTSRLTL